MIGDIVGSRFEFDNHRSKEFELFTEDCQVTDDTYFDPCCCEGNDDKHSELQTNFKVMRYVFCNSNNICLFMININKFM